MSTVSFASIQSLKPDNCQSEDLGFLINAIPPISDQTINIFKKYALQKSSMSEWTHTFVQTLNDEVNNLDKAKIDRPHMCKIIFSALIGIALLVAAIAFPLLFPGVLLYILSAITLLLVYLSYTIAQGAISSRKSCDTAEIECNEKLRRLEEFCNAHGIETQIQMQSKLYMLEKEYSDICSKRPNSSYRSPLSNMMNENADFPMQEEIKNLRESIHHLNHFMELIQRIEIKKLCKMSS